MKNYAYLSILVFSLFSCRYTNAPDQKVTTEKSTTPTDFLFQYSIIDALLGGVYDGHFTVGQLKERGDFGIGTFNGLDGEMVVKDGKVFKVRHDGEVKEMSDSVKTPLSFVKFFQTDTTVTYRGKPMTYEGLKEYLAPYLNQNKMYAVRIRGKYERIDARSVSPVSKPYPDLASHIAAGGQTSFTFSDTEGSLIGFIAPQFTARANIPGYHLHYLDDRHLQGGHVFDFLAENMVIEIDQIQGFTVELNSHEDFETVDLAKNRNQELIKVEHKE
jgi:acetolactate decarboxylase